MLNRFRDNADKWLDPIAKKISIKADTLSYLSLLSAFFAGVLLYLSYENNWLLIAASLFILLNGFFDALDGKIARMKGTSSLRGDFIDHAIDRFADAFMIGGIALSPWCGKGIGIAAITSVLLTSYMGTQAQAVGYKRIYRGILGRADRIVLLFFATIVQYFVQYRIHGFYFIEWLMIYFIIAGIITIIQRFFEVLKNMS
ncbi:MAG: CDP-alcohol phosphatidyltransferase family protein [Thermoplasmata archaeon]|nr:CDP-alcohol phosphatidyltransferase family protein [Thermoplasmata archaeon]